jgi:UDP-2-acetamido-3-amino-2,3-dideoxy-glucuronate N-acetyltransferase
MDIAVIGAGWWGTNIINTLEGISAVKKIFVFDKDPGTYNKFSGNQKTVFTKSQDEIFNADSIKAVCIASPPKTHYELSKTALLSNKHVLVEKPPAYETAQVKELGKIAKEKNLIYMLDVLYLFLEPIRKLKEIINSPQLKEIKFVQIYRIGDELRREGSGLSRITNAMYDNNIDVIEDLFFHDAGILIYLFGDVELKGVTKNYIYHGSLCDSSGINFQKNGFLIELTLSWTFSGRRRGMTIYGKDYIVEYDGLKSGEQIKITELSSQKTQVFSFQNTEPLKDLLSYFISSVSNKQDTFCGTDFMEKATALFIKIKSYA